MVPIKAMFMYVCVREKGCITLYYWRLIWSITITEISKLELAENSTQNSHYQLRSSEWLSALSASSGGGQWWIHDFILEEANSLFLFIYFGVFDEIGWYGSALI